MKMPIPREPAFTRATALSVWPGSLATSLQPRRTVVRRKTLERLPRHQHQPAPDEEPVHDIDPEERRVETTVEEDSVVSEADRPQPPTDKPEA